MNSTPRFAVSIAIKTALLAPGLLLWGCQSLGRAKPVDLSTPQSAAMSYVKALQYGDAATARAACTGTEEEMRWVDAMAAMVRGLRDINSALYAHFGPVSSQMHVDLEESIRTLADEPVELFENGVVQANDLQVRIIPQHKGFTSKFQTPLVLSKVKNVWKVDLEQTYL